MPAGNFDEELIVELDGEGVGIVHATGPLDEAVKAVTVMCVWVLQRDGADDAIGNAMGSPNGMSSMPEMHTASIGPGLTVKQEDLGTPNARWTFPLTDRLKPVDFREGSATAMAIGVFVDEQGNQRAFFWAEPVRLVGAGAIPSR
jgi:hypothetical protein